ncbi:MAG: ATP-binding protein [Vicinamibacteria bacterium]
MRCLHRDRRDAAVRLSLRRNPVVALLGPRQCGKSTLARAIAGQSGKATFFDLEDPRDLAKLEDPMLGLADARGLVVLDEIQRRPELFPALRVLADRRPLPARFLVLGSASRDLLRQSSESLAGRIAYLEMDGFALDEASVARFGPLWVRGGSPRSLLARTESESVGWRREFVRSFVERDLPQLGSNVSASTIGRFWAMLAHYHGQIWNASEFARAFGVSEASVRRYADLLTETFVVRRLSPWSENLGKRQVKSPKLYIADTGILHSLLGIDDRAGLERHPKIGASWESFGITQVVERLGVSRDECYFWATQAGAELDLLVVRGKHRMGFEFKRTVAPAVTKSMHIARADLRLTSLEVVHAGDHTFPLREGIRALSLKRILTDLKPLS